MNDDADARWTFAEATVLRATGFTHLVMLAVGLLSPRAIFAPWGVPIDEPATFYRFALVVLGTLGLALVRAARRPVREGVLLVETAGLAMIAFFVVLLADGMAHRIASRAAFAGVVDLVFGAALFRIGRRRLRP
jgi:hypothetical protein